MKSIWDGAVRQQTMARFAQLKADAKPLWGRMNAAQMVAHVIDPMKTAMGEKQVAQKYGPLRNRLMRYLVIYHIPWPKDAPTAPEFIHTGPEDLEKNRKQLAVVIERLALTGSQEPLRPHPAFGAMSNKDWGCLTWRHLDHHLRQFGL